VKPASCQAAETNGFYFVSSSVRKIGQHSRPPAPRPALEHLGVVKQPIEERGDRCRITEHFR